MALMNKMAAESDDTLVALVFSHFVKFSKQCKKDKAEKALEELVEKTGKALAEHMERKKAEAKGVQHALYLLMQCVQAWAQIAGVIPQFRQFGSTFGQK